MRLLEYYARLLNRIKHPFDINCLNFKRPPGTMGCIHIHPARRDGKGHFASACNITFVSMESAVLSPKRDGSQRQTRCMKDDVLESGCISYIHYNCVHLQLVNLVNSLSCNVSALSYQADLLREARYIGHFPNDPCVFRER